MIKKIAYSRGVNAEARKNDNREDIDTVLRKALVFLLD